MVLEFECVKILAAQLDVPSFTNNPLHLWHRSEPGKLEYFGFNTLVTWNIRSGVQNTKEIVHADSRTGGVTTQTDLLRWVRWFPGCWIERQEFSQNQSDRCGHQLVSNCCISD